MLNHLRNWAVAVLLFPTAAVAAPPRVHLEVLFEKRVSVEQPQQWLRLLQDLPLATIRVRQIRPGEMPGLDRRGTEASPTLHVKAVLGADGQLHLPDGRFRLSDKQRIIRWLEEASSGTADSGNARAAFGLTDAQLVSVFGKLSVPLRMETHDKRVSHVVQRVRSTLNVPISIDEPSMTRIRGGQIVRDELDGLSCGTALAALVRPLGAAVVPFVAADGSVSLRIIEGRQATEAWPVGWEPETRTRETLPKLFDYLRVEIADTPLDEALNALQSRLDVPLLVDHNGLAARQISLEDTRVRFPPKRTFYKRVLDQILFQARLDGELRVDEAKQPFLWITPTTLPR